MKSKKIFMNIRTKLGLFAVLIFAVISLVIFGIVIPLVEKEKHIEREATLRALNSSVVSILEYYEEAVRLEKWRNDPNLPHTRAEAKLRAIEFIKNSRFGKGEFFFILDGDAKMVMHPLKSDMDGKDMSLVEAPDGSRPFYEMAIQAQVHEVVFIKYNWLSKWSQTVYEPQTTCAQFFYPWNWVVCSNMHTQDIVDAVDEFTYKTGLYLLFGSLCGMLLLYIIGFYLSRPIVQLASQVKRIGFTNNSLVSEMITVKSNDEIGDLARVFKGTLDHLQKTLVSLSEQEERYRQLFDNANDAILIAQDGIIAFCNKKTEEIIECTVEELHATPFVELIHPEDREYVLDYHLRRIKGESEVPSTYSFRILSQKENEVTVQISSVLVDWNGRPATLNFIRDITEIKILEKKYLQAQKMEAIGSLAGGVAHDLNNILSGIKTYPELLLLKLPEDSPHRQIVKAIHESGKRAGAIVKDMLTLARRGVEVSEITNLNILVAEYLSSPEFQKLKSTYPDVTIITDLSADLKNLKGSPVHLSKTIMNLVGNGVESIVDKGQVTITTENQFIEKSIKDYGQLAEGTYAVLKITDDGSGIPEEIQEKIFEPFYTKKEMGRSGTGLGLSIVWGTLEDHNGHIDVKSVVGEGTEFTLFFPVVSGTLPSKQSRPSSEYSGNGERVLVVDDSRNQRELATNVLETLKYQVVAKESGEDAIEFLQDNEVDIILLDMIMESGMDGLETYIHIRKVAENSKTIIVSGFSETDRVKRAMALGVVDYIQKPYTIEQLAESIKKVLSG